MTEKEKLKEIIETALGFHDYYKVVVTEKDIDRLVDKLIENGIRDITEKGVVAVEGEISIVPENFVADIKFALDGNVDELKRRAEVAESELEKHKRALRIAAPRLKCYGGLGKGFCSIQGCEYHHCENAEGCVAAHLREASRRIEEEERK